ncbi:MAG: histidine phosphotransferase family protein [Alphaproteobacteria bacterium]
MNDPTIDALVSSRICHDLISPVGAISNGVELLAELATTMPEIALIADSVDSATAKLKFFRVCFGQTPEGAMTGTSELATIGSDMFQSTRMTVNWQLQSVAFTRETAKMLYLLLLCVETTLPLGGVITVVQDGDNWEVRAEGKRIQIVDAWKLVNGQSSVDATPAQVHFLLVYRHGLHLGRNVAMVAAETNLTVKF